MIRGGGKVGVPVVLGLLEVGEDGLVVPARVAGVGPVVIVQLVTPDQRISAGIINHFDRAVPSL